MKNILLFLFIIVCSKNIFSSEIEVKSTVNKVTIYHSGALITRVSNQDFTEGVNELIFYNVSSKIILNTIRINNKEITILNKSLIKKLTPEESNRLSDEKDALTKEIQLIDSKFNQLNFINNVEELEKMTSFYKNKITELKKELRKVSQLIAESQKFETIKLSNENAAILKLTVSIEKKIQNPFELQYISGGIGWSPSYELFVTSPSSNSIELKYLSKIMSQTGEDWENISITLSSSFPLESPNELPKPEEPWILEGRISKRKINNTLNQLNENQVIKLDGVEYQEINAPMYLEPRELKGKYSIKSNNTIFTFPIQNTTLPVHFGYYSFPSISPEVFLVASLTNWESYGFVDGIANISYKGNNIGKSILNFSENKDTLLLSIGKDNSIFLKRSEISDKNTNNKNKVNLAYQFELKNNNSYPIQIELYEQYPISQTKSAEVELTKISNGKIDSENGIIRWDVTLEPSQSKQIEFLYEIDINGNYSFTRNKPQKFKTLSCPSF